MGINVFACAHVHARMLTHTHAHTYECKHADMVIHVRVSAPARTDVRTRIARRRMSCLCDPLLYFILMAH